MQVRKFSWKRKISILVVLLLFVMSTVAFNRSKSDLPDGLYAEMETSKGTILLSLYFEKTPLTVMNFVGLAEGSFTTTSREGPFYDGLVFHRVIDDFMVQGGDPQGNGTGGPGYQFSDEIVDDLVFDGPGVLAMANSGPATNGSQFFITHVPTPWLQGKHTIFGRVLEGQDVVDAIAQGDKLEKITIIRQGNKAKDFQPSDEKFEELKVSSMKKFQEEKAAAGEKMLQEINQRWPDAQQSPSGIRYLVLNEGGGEKPSKGTQVTVHYTGTFLDGKTFDSSRDRGEPFQFAVGQGQVIPGWDEMVMDMRKGERRTIVLPPETAYGSRGAGGVIPPDTWLVFDVELISF